MPCKAYNSKGCIKHCQTYEEALIVGGQCCIYCYCGKVKGACPECNLKEVEDDSEIQEYYKNHK